MFKINLVNVQAIGEACLEFEDNSIVEFIGDNSNGKSVISKVIEALTKGDLKDEETRLSLIKDETEQAVIIFTHNNQQLGILLRRAVKDSFIMYVPDLNDAENKILRTVNDTEGVKSLIYEFGFRTYSGGDICLQLSPTFGSIPFVTTGGSTNGEIVTDITVDKVAEEFLSAYHTITYPIIKEKLKNLKKDREATQTILDSLDSYDWREYDDIATRMSEKYQLLLNLPFYELSNLDLPDIEFTPYQPWVPNYPISVEFFEYIPIDTFDEQMFIDYEKVMAGVCPTCGKRLFDT